MHRHGRRDSTHAEVKQTLRDMGASVADLADVGGDLPDLLVGICRRNYWVEVKSPTGKQSEGQVRFSATWRGDPPVVLRSASDAVEWATMVLHEYHRHATPVVIPVATTRAERIDGRYSGRAKEDS